MAGLLQFPAAVPCYGSPQTFFKIHLGQEILLIAYALDSFSFGAIQDNALLGDEISNFVGFARKLYSSSPEAFHSGYFRAARKHRYRQTKAPPRLRNQAGGYRLGNNRSSFVRTTALASLTVHSGDNIVIRRRRLHALIAVSRPSDGVRQKGIVAARDG